MLKNVLIFFSTLFFFFSISLELNSLTRDQLLKIKQKVSVINSIVTKVRSKRFKLNLEKYKKSKIVFDAINKKEWNKATKLSKNDGILRKIVAWHFLYENNTNLVILIQEHPKLNVQSYFY